MPNAAIRSGKEDRDNDTDLELEDKGMLQIEPGKVASFQQTHLPNSFFFFFPLFFSSSI